MTSNNLKPQDYHELRSRLQRYAKRLDAQYKIPGTQIMFGWDSIIGFIPIVGDLLTALISLYLIVLARNIGAPIPLILKMAGNVLLELFAGVIPFFGDIFDIYWKANQRNVALLDEYLDKKISPPPQTQRSYIKLWILLAVFVVVWLILYLLSTNFDYLN